jgi:hypothetical protein
MNGALSAAGFARQRGSIAIRNRATSAISVASTASEPRPCLTVGGGYGRAAGLAVSGCSVSTVTSICHGDSNASVPFAVLVGRTVRVSSKCRRVIWPKAIRLNGNAPIVVMPNGPADARMGAASDPAPLSPSMRATRFIDDLVKVSVVFVIINPPFDFGSVGILFARSFFATGVVTPPVEVAAAISAKVVMHAGHIGLSYSVQLSDERASAFRTLSSNFFFVISEMGGASMKTSIC